MTTSVKIGRVIRRLRQAQGISAETLGLEIGVSKPEMTRKERGLSAITVDQLDDIAKALSTTSIDIWREVLTPSGNEKLELNTNYDAADDETKRSVQHILRTAVSRSKRVRLR